jgi:hypothetical protein
MQAGAAVVPALEGVVAILDKKGRLVSVLDVAALIGSQGSTHPHDAIFLRNGDIVVGTWDWGYVSYWKKLPALAAAGIADDVTSPES